MRSVTEDLVEIDVEFTEEEIQVLRPFAAHLNLTLEQTASVLVARGLWKIASDLGAESVEDLDPEEALRYLLEETEVDDA